MSNCLARADGPKSKAPVNLYLAPEGTAPANVGLHTTFDARSPNGLKTARVRECLNLVLKYSTDQTVTPARVTTEVGTGTSDSKSAATKIRDASLFICEVAKQSKAGQLGSALRLLYREMDELLLAQDQSTAAFAIYCALRSGLPTEVLVGVLTITLPWRDELRLPRTLVAEAIRSNLKESGREEKTAAVLAGLV